MGIPLSTTATAEREFESLNVVFLGHVDHGKSSTCGELLINSVSDAHFASKLQSDAESRGRGTAYKTYAIDTNDEEKNKGKTVELGCASFVSKKRIFNILDAPGHRNYMGNMVLGAAQADVAVLVVSAKMNEFEAGFQGGQTKDHAIIAKSMGVKEMIVALNKMDDPMADWSEERFNLLVKTISSSLKTVGFKPKFIPISALKGENISSPLPTSHPAHSWYHGPSLLQCLHDLPPSSFYYRDLMNTPLRITITAKYKDQQQIVILGKIESGLIHLGDSIQISPLPTNTPQHMPSNISFSVFSLILGGADPISSTTSSTASINSTNHPLFVSEARAGDMIRIGLREREVEEFYEKMGSSSVSALQSGHVIYHPAHPVLVSTRIAVHLKLLELSPNVPLFQKGSEGMLHLHSATVPVSVLTLLANPSSQRGGPNGKPGGKPWDPVRDAPRYVKVGEETWAILEAAQPVALEIFENFRGLGRFALREQGITVGVGKVIGISGDDVRKRGKEILEKQNEIKK